MKKNKILLVLLLSLSFNFVYSQSVTIEGVIMDKENLIPVSDALVYLNLRGTQLVYSQNDGTFSFENYTGDLYGKYNLSIYKPGYQKKDIVIDIPIRDHILLQKSSQCYIQILSKENGYETFLEGLEIRHQQSEVDTTDRFGYYIIDLPQGIPNEKKYSISILGGYRYHNENIQFSAKDLKDGVIRIVLTPKKLTYFNLKKALEDILDQYWDGLLIDDLEKQNLSLDKAQQILREIYNLEFLTTAERADFRNNIPYISSQVNKLQMISISLEDIEKLENKHSESVDRFNDELSKYEKYPPSLSQIPERMQEIIDLGFIALKYSIERYKIYPYGMNLVESDAKELVKLIDYLNELKDTSIFDQLPNKEDTTNKIHGVIERSSNHLENYIKQIQTQ